MYKLMVLFFVVVQTEKFSLVTVLTCGKWGDVRWSLLVGSYAYLIHFSSIFFLIFQTLQILDSFQILSPDSWAKTFWWTIKLSWFPQILEPSPFNIVYFCIPNRIKDYFLLHPWSTYLILIRGRLPRINEMKWNEEKRSITLILIVVFKARRLVSQQRQWGLGSW